MSIKIRHDPFSVYVCFQAPASVKGQEVIYVAGRNQGNLLAHKAHVPVTVSLHPDGLIAMNGRHYPITEIGLVNLVRRLVEVGQQDLNHGECEVKYFTGAKVEQAALHRHPSGPSDPAGLLSIPSGPGVRR